MKWGEFLEGGQRLQHSARRTGTREPLPARVLPVMDPNASAGEAVPGGLGKHPTPCTGASHVAGRGAVHAVHPEGTLLQGHSYSGLESSRGDLAGLCCSTFMP